MGRLSEDFSDFPDESWMVHSFSRVFFGGGGGKCLKINRHWYNGNITVNAVI